MQIHKTTLVPITRSLRKKQTPWESKLWRQLRANRFDGLKFKRQVMIGEYVVDFCCNDKKLVIELDGSQHNIPEMKKDDARRSRYLESYGYRILRFWNNQIDDNIEGVLDTIYRAVG